MRDRFVEDFILFALKKKTMKKHLSKSLKYKKI
jgi:hypothetical protein